MNETSTRSPVHES